MEEPHKLHEHAEVGHNDPNLAPVSVTMAILAVLVAAVSLLGHRAHGERVLAQTKASDQWAFYQAKNIRRHNYELFLDLLTVSEVKDSARAAEVRKKYEQEAARYKKEQGEIETDARNLEHESDHYRRTADRFDLGEGLLEAALVIASLTILTYRKIFWRAGMLLGLAGVVVALTAYLVH
jgi:hypothetical protein